MHFLRHFYPAILTCSITLATPSLTQAAPGPGAAGTFGNKRVVLFGIDGCRSDALKKAVENGTAPNIAQLIKDGAVTWNAYAGGKLGTTTQQPTMSGPGWTSVLTAVWADKHGVTDNAFTGKNFTDYPHFFKRIKDANPACSLSSLVSWPEIHTHITEDSGGDAICSCHTYTAGSYDARDAALITKTVEIVTNENPDVVFCYQADVDISGHNNQFHPDNAAYMASIATADQRIGQVLTAIRNRPLFDQEDWLFIITSDHGGKGNGHGGQSDEERIIPFIVSGGNTPKGLISNIIIGQVAAPSTAMRHLGLSIPSSWGWEGHAFLIGNQLEAATAADAIHLTWQLPAGGIDGLTGFTLQRDGSTVATLAATARNFSDTSVSPGEGTVSYTLLLDGSSEKPLTVTANLPSPANPSAAGPVLHLTFDNTLDDASGNGNHASPSGTAQYETGVSNQCIRLDSTHQALLGDTTSGAPSDLRFGDSTDFTISFWIKATAGWSGDPALISNKSWATGANNGWIIAQESNGQDWQWNLKGLSANRLDFDPQNAPIQDGDWHLITVTHDRDGNAVFYHDGASIGTVSIAGSGNIDTSLPIRLGVDGANAYPVNQPVLIDEVKIWRRNLNAKEVAEEFSAFTPRAAYQRYIEEQAALYNDQTGLLNPTDDPDGDFATNLMEFASGTLPFDGTSRPYFTIAANPNGTATLRFLQRNGGNGVHGINQQYSVDGITYTITNSPNLTQPWAGTIDTLTQKPAGSAAGPLRSQTHEIAVDVTPTSDRGFFRIEVDFTQP